MLNNHRFVGAIIAVSGCQRSHSAANNRMRWATCGAAALVSSWLLATASATAQTADVQGADSLPARQARQIVVTAPSEYQMLHVDPALGSDSADGTVAEPLQTVTRALEMAAPNTVIVLAPGRYSRASGEVFPLQLKSGVTIQGGPGARDRTAIIEGGGSFESPMRSQQNAAIIAADRAGIAQVAISNSDGYGVWVESASPTILETAFVGNRQAGIYVAGGSPRVQNNYFSGNKVAGLIVFDRSNARITRNTFDSTGDAIRVAQGATPEIAENRMTNNNAGIVLIGDARPAVRDNQIIGNRQNEVVRVAAAGRELLPAAAASVSDFGEAMPVTKKTPIPADAVPGGPVADVPILAAALPMTSQPQMLEPVSSSLAASSAGRPDLNQSATSQSASVRSAVERADLPRLQLIPPGPVDTEPAETVREPVGGRVSNRAAWSEPEGSQVEEAATAEGSREVIPNGSPGAALAALQSGVALVPRAVSGENPDSPILRRRRERRDRDDNNLREDNNRPAEFEGRDSTLRQPLPLPVNSNRLSVPNSRIPLGSGSSSIIFSPPTGGVGMPPAPPSRAQALGLFYRVFVEATDPIEQDEVREVIGDAFRTRLDGRTVMQVGAFPTEEEAEERQRILEDNGFDARIEFIR